MCAMNSSSNTVMPGLDRFELRLHDERQRAPALTARLLPLLQRRLGGARPRECIVNSGIVAVGERQHEPDVPVVRPELDRGAGLVPAVHERASAP
jgi:hypothetical protein